MVSIFSPDWRNEILRQMGAFLTQTAGDARYLQPAAADIRYLQIANEGQISGIRNWVINGNFTINQRSGTRTPGIGTYGFDRWKGHASGLQQIIEALPAGQYTLKWTGGGTGTFGGVTAASPFVATTAMGNISVIVPANATRVSLVPGDARNDVDPFSERHIAQEMALCQRYYQYVTIIMNATGTAGTYVGYNYPMPVVMRTIPTVLNVNTSGSTNLDTFSYPATNRSIEGAARPISTGWCKLSIAANLDAEL